MRAPVERARRPGRTAPSRNLPAALTLTRRPFSPSLMLDEPLEDHKKVIAIMLELGTHQTTSCVGADICVGWMGRISGHTRQRTSLAWSLPVLPQPLCQPSEVRHGGARGAGLLETQSPALMLTFSNPHPGVAVRRSGWTS